MILPREFYARPTLTVARDLIGKVLVHEAPAGTTAGVIVEVEAYIGESDPACHAAPGPTARNAPLYGPPGIAYVYLNYGIHYLVNAVTEPEGSPAAVLIRALDPVDGEALMRRRRSRGTGRSASAFARPELCRGPGNLTRAMGISLRRNRFDLTSGPLRIEDRGTATPWSSGAGGSGSPSAWSRSGAATLLTARRFHEKEEGRRRTEEEEGARAGDVKGSASALKDSSFLPSSFCLPSSFLHTLVRAPDAWTIDTRIVRSRPLLRMPNVAVEPIAGVGQQTDEVRRVVDLSCR